MTALAVRHRGRAAGRPRARSVPLRGLLPLAIGLLAWQLVGDSRSVSFPPPSTWLSSLGDLQSEGELIPAIAATARTFLIALVLATLVGGAIGTAIGASRRAERALDPLLEFLRAVPAPVIVPIAILLLGVTVRTAILIVAFASIWPILLNAAAAVRGIPRVRLEMARTLSLSRRERVRKVIVPSLTPGIVLGVQVAAPICLIVTVVVEVLASAGGTGTLLLEGQRTLNAPQAFGVLLVIGVLALLVSMLVAWLEGIALRNWPPRARSGAA